MNTLEEWTQDFVKKQEDLGDEFKKVLHDNLWELYDNEELK